MIRLPFNSAIVLALITLISPASAQSDFESCGTLVTGVECVLFRADSNDQSYVIANRASFVAGDRVRVVGRLDAACVSACQQGGGCIEENTIEACPPEVDACGVLIQGVECALFQPDGELRTYVLEILGEFKVGDRVHVTGTRDSSCLTICGQSSGCIVDNTISTADETCPPATPVCALATFSLPLFVPLVILGLRGVMKPARGI